MMQVEVKILTKRKDGNKLFCAKGKLENQGEKIILTYRQESNLVTITLQNGTVTMEREGDCYLYLLFQADQKTKGFIGLSREQKGEIEITTTACGYLFDCNELQVTLNYLLSTDIENNFTSLRLSAKRV